jgi:hypothetical protein
MRFLMLCKHRWQATRFAPRLHLVLAVVSALTGVACGPSTLERGRPDDARPSGNAGQPTSQETTAEGAVAFPISEGFESCRGNPAMPLPSFDYGNVGYHGGAPLPDKPATRTFPAGRHTITNPIVLKTGDVLRGAGRDKTILYFPEGLKQMGVPCRDGTFTNNDCFDWPEANSRTSDLFMGVIGAMGSEIGIEDLTIEFPANHAWTHHAKHEGTSGYNGFELKQCTNCWIKDVSIKNADNSIMVSDGGNNTIQGVHLYARPGGGHIHVAYVNSDNNLTTNFRMYGTSSHGLVNNWGGENNVFANGWVENLKLEADHSCGSRRHGDEICTKNLLYSNISGKIGAIQTIDRKGDPVEKVLWNVGNLDRCPLDAYTAQHSNETRRGGT